MTEQNPEEIIFNENHDIDAELKFKKACQETLEKRNETPEHIIDLATRVHRVNGLRAIVREARKNTFQETITKARNLANKAELVKMFVTKSHGVA